jgi:predicted acyl esterase
MRRFLALLLLAIASCHALADDAGAAKLLALFPKFDADHSGVLSPEEQTKAVESVKKIYGDQWAQQIRNMFASAAAADKSVSMESWRQQVANYGHAPVAQTVQIPMRDGKKLATDIYMPKGVGPFPVVLSRTPYSRVKQKDGPGGYAANGTVYISQDMRGRFDSEGENLPFIGCGWGEHEDGVDTLAWIMRQPWCNGKIGTIGGSAGGITQNLLAGAAPAGLKAQYISVAAASLYSDACYIGGAFRKADMEGWLTQNKFDPQELATMRANPSYDDYWRQFDTTLKFPVMDAPAVQIGGWFDMFTQGTIDEFVGRQHSGAAGARGAQKLIMGPWTHSIGRMPVGQLRFPNASVPAQYNSGRWFAHYLRGENNGVEKEPAVTYYVMGDTSAPGAPGNVWRQADDWPVPATETAYYFAPEGKLGSAQPSTAADAHVKFTFDPANPCPTIGGNNLELARGPMNQNPIENRKDVILFTTAPLESPVEITGRVKARIFVSSSARDTDLSVRLCDVYPDGKSYLIAEGMRRLRYRDSFEKPELLTPGKLYEVTVDCWSTSIIFNTGHRIRATITSSNYPRLDLNPGTGEQWSDSGPKVIQTNDILCDAAHASRLLLPVVPMKQAP